MCIEYVGSCITDGGYMTHSDNSTTPIKRKHCKSMYEVIGIHVTCMGKNNDEVVCCRHFMADTVLFLSLILHTKYDKLGYGTTINRRVTNF